MTVVSETAVDAVTTATGPEYWIPQVAYSNLSLEKDKTYLISFTISADIDTNIGVSIQKGDDDYDTWFWEEVSVSPEPTSYSFEFTVPETYTNVQWVTAIGYSCGTYHISDASLVCLE